METVHLIFRLGFIVYLAHLKYRKTPNITSSDCHFQTLGTEEYRRLRHLPVTPTGYSSGLEFGLSRVEHMTQISEVPLEVEVRWQGVLLRAADTTSTGTTEVRVPHEGPTQPVRAELMGDG